MRNCPPYALRFAAAASSSSAARCAAACLLCTLGADAAAAAAAGASCTAAGASCSSLFARPSSHCRPAKYSSRQFVAHQRMLWGAGERCGYDRSARRANLRAEAPSAAARGRTRPAHRTAAQQPGKQAAAVSVAWCRLKILGTGSAAAAAGCGRDAALHAKAPAAASLTAGARTHEEDGHSPASRCVSVMHV
ncbi:hypothetical protein COO60DRAFT_1157476 [Scenedesmus sp. NREL 46B-D3]|nr:hypothetical protein COO60DRAFT_1157476 [Scenedesmus sp. NREL 46B-D3]